MLASWLELAVEELQAVVEDILIGGVQAGLDTIPNHIGSSGRTLQLQDLQSREIHGAMSNPDTNVFIHKYEKIPIWNIKEKYFRLLAPQMCLHADIDEKNVSPVKVDNENRGGWVGAQVQEQ